jgi:hypothetical protein
MWDRLFYPVDYWLGRGRPLNPYLRGYLVDYMRRELRLRDLRVCPDKMFQQIGIRGMVSSTRMDAILAKTSLLVRVCSFTT